MRVQRRRRHPQHRQQLLAALALSVTYSSSSCRCCGWRQRAAADDETCPCIMLSITDWPLAIQQGARAIITAAARLPAASSAAPPVPYSHSCWRLWHGCDCQPYCSQPCSRHPEPRRPELTPRVAMVRRNSPCLPLRHGACRLSEIRPSHGTPTQLACVPVGCHFSKVRGLSLNPNRSRRRINK